MTTPPQGSAGSNPGRIYTILGAVFGVIAIIFIPIIFGPAGIILGFVGNAKGDKPYGLWVGIGSIVTMILGFILGAVAFNSMN